MLPRDGRHYSPTGCQAVLSSTHGSTRPRASRRAGSR
jgi:hypothetical protein